MFKIGIFFYFVKIWLCAELVKFLNAYTFLILLRLEEVTLPAEMNAVPLLSRWENLSPGRVCSIVKRTF